MFGAITFSFSYFQRIRRKETVNENRHVEDRRSWHNYVRKRSQDRLSFSNLQFLCTPNRSLSGREKYYLASEDSASSSSDDDYVDEKVFVNSITQSSVDHFEPHPENESRGSKRPDDLKNTTSKKDLREYLLRGSIKIEKVGASPKSKSRGISSHSSLDKLLEGEDVRKDCPDEMFSSSLEAHDHSKDNDEVSFSEKRLGLRPGSAPSTNPSVSDRSWNLGLQVFKRREDHQLDRRSASLEVNSECKRNQHVGKKSQAVLSSKTVGHVNALSSSTTLQTRISSVPNLLKLFDTNSHKTGFVDMGLSNQATGGEEQTIRSQSRAARVNYNASIMPSRLILIRHGQSLGNVNELLYSTTPDNAMPLTNLGWDQAKEAGKFLKQMLSRPQHQSVEPNDPQLHPDPSREVANVHFVISPYVRTVETFQGIVAAWCDPFEFSHIVNLETRLAAWYSRLGELGISWQQDPRIREQDFGNYQERNEIRKAKKDRHRFGAFYYRFPYGESASDVRIPCNGEMHNSLNCGSFSLASCPISLSHVDPRYLIESRLS